MAHNLSTTVVEIDPAVYAAARTYFGLPEPSAVYLEDARGWIELQANKTAAEKYDIVVHDCFSGGGVPEFLFTSEFWEELKQIVSPEGIVAVVRRNNFLPLVRYELTSRLYYRTTLGS